MRISCLKKIICLIQITYSNTIVSITTDIIHSETKSDNSNAILSLFKIISIICYNTKFFSEQIRDNSHITRFMTENKPLTNIVIRFMAKNKSPGNIVIQSLTVTISGIISLIKLLSYNIPDTFRADEFQSPTVSDKDLSS